MIRKKSIISLFISCFISLSIIVVPLVHACPLVKSFEGVIEYYQVEETPVGFLVNLSHTEDEKNSFSDLHTGLADHIDHQTCPPIKQYLFLSGSGDRSLQELPLLVSSLKLIEERRENLFHIPPSFVHEALLASHKKGYTLFKSTLSPPSL